VKTVSGLVALITFVGVAMASCNDTQFGSSTPNRGTQTGTDSGTPTGEKGGTDSGPETPPPTDTTTGTSTAPGGDESSGECVEGDFINYKYDGPIQKCIDEGKIWNFDVDQCTNMRKAEFDCTFDGFFARLGEIGLQPTALLQEGKAGQPRKALIMGCGESQDKETVLIQWFFVPEGGSVGCNFDKSRGLIITGCYGKDSGPADASPEEKKKIVLACMNGLGG
jgi:hypothetical protein